MHPSSSILAAFGLIAATVILPQAAAMPASPPAHTANNAAIASSEKHGAGDIARSVDKATDTADLHARQACKPVGQQSCMWFSLAGSASPSRVECSADGAYHVIETCAFGSNCHVDASGTAVCVGP
ncbi:hypothetical protein Micbo1qcDRAFT_199774 [Microdochium bolleyi]|uniref:Carbohydrate-binding module family 19 domain-containing protein n=1 Tax=Microdochium bolleyi TaxID=196109 RepID=A0A136JIQ5_9PEZI|nr:hypothetical protein Micbo1qcDRAFT_199774 [Microdochium bolleyi]